MPAREAEIARLLLGSPVRAATTYQPISADDVHPMMRNYKPTFRERVGNTVYDAASLFGLGGTANRMRNDAMAAVDFVPVLGDAVGFDDARRDFNAGNYGSAAAGLGLTALGAVPGVGDVAASGAKSLMARAAEMGVDLYISAPKGRMVIDKIVVPPDARNKGVGSQIMQEITQFADSNQIPLSLTPSTDFGGTKQGLDRFYKRFGFEPNVGRKRDFEIYEAMRRYPIK